MIAVEYFGFRKGCCHKRAVVPSFVFTSLELKKQGIRTKLSVPVRRKELTNYLVLKSIVLPLFGKVYAFQVVFDNEALINCIVDDDVKR